MTAIVPGDLVMVVRSRNCCQIPSRVIGMVFTAGNISQSFGFCESCGKLAGMQWTVDWPNKGKIEMSRLKKITPPALESDTQAEREMQG